MQPRTDNSSIEFQGSLLFTRKTRKFWLENEMVHTIPFLSLSIDTSTFYDVSICG